MIWRIRNKAYWAPFEVRLMRTPQGAWLYGQVYGWAFTISTRLFKKKPFWFSQYNQEPK